MDRDPEAFDDAEELPADLTEPVAVDAEVPEADALDQHRATSDADRRAQEPRQIPAEVPEADALEQSRAVPVDEDARED